ncbi:hypothetical protein DPV78_003969 [Talaromyces pinophilus]|nr:hypothetical protein DPV78_003969 [Talaromyces pinophilus]
MQRLPTELYDRIIDYVAVLRDDPPFKTHLMYPSIPFLRKQAQEALKSLRLVNKTLSRSASRALFGGVSARLGHGVSSISKLEAISSSEYAQYVRFIRFDICASDWYEPVRGQEAGEDIRVKGQDDKDEDIESQERDVEDLEDEDENEEEDEEEDDEEDEEGVIRLSDKGLNHLSTLIAKFCNLQAFDVLTEELIPFEGAIGFLSQIVITIADLQLRGFIRKVTDLRLPIDGATHLTTLLYDNSDHQAAVRHLLHNIQHLDFIFFVGMDYVMDDVLTKPVDLDALIRVSPNLLSLQVCCACTLTPLKSFDSSLRLRLETLDLEDLEISSYHLLTLLEQSKGSIRFISLERIKLISGSWLHVLFQIKKNLNLIGFFFNLNDPYLYDFMEEEGLLREDIMFLMLVIGDIQRQSNANRIIAGLKPVTEKLYLYLDHEPLEEVMEKEWYEELNSESWDAENPRTSYLELVKSCI